jgi:hypothetical protein
LLFLKHSDKKFPIAVQNRTTQFGAVEIPKDRNKTRYDEITIKREERNDEETTKAELSTVPLQLSAGQVGWLLASVVGGGGAWCWLMGNG